jgi:hypothetical protein
MNRLRSEQLWPVIKAYAKGAKIQWFNAETERWVDHGNPTFAMEHQWRVKPEDEAFEFWWDKHHAGWPKTEKDIAARAWEAAKNQ